MLRIAKKAQSTAEYAILISLVIAAAMGIQNEVRRSLQARIHNEVMKLSDGQQYEPAQSNKTTTNQTSHREKHENFVEGNGGNEVYMHNTEQNSADYTAVTIQ
jgi:hypothetical protein